MTYLVVGASHHTAPVELLERLSVSPGQAPALLADLVAQPFVSSAVVLSTCNRVEIYATVTAFHGGLAEIGAVLAARADCAVADLADHLYVHYEADAVRHALRVAAGLDSMVIGEAQILGQLRDAYGIAAEHDATDTLSHELMQCALRVGKRVHAETAIDRAGQSVVSAALGLVPAGVSERRCLVVGAGAMGALSLATLRRDGASPLLVTNRDPDRAARLADLHDALSVDFADLDSALSTVDLVVCATASPTPVLTATAVSAALERRAANPQSNANHPYGDLVILDLAVPRDVEPAVGELAGVLLIDVAAIGRAHGSVPAGAEHAQAEAIVTAEVATFLGWLRGSDVTPTVAALRARADEVVTAELDRLAARCPALTDDQRAAVAQAVHRVVQRLLHPPTVRVRQLAATADGDQYAAVLRELFDLSVPVGEKNLGRAVGVEPTTGPTDATREVEPR